MEDYSFVKIPTGIWAKRFEHSFILGGCRYPVICGTTETPIPTYVYAPYIPMMDLETEFQPRQGIVSRYATKMVNEGFYGRITVNELHNGVQLPKIRRRFS